MILRLLFVVVLLLSTPGCVAAIPLAAQLATSGNAAKQLCSAAKLSGQSALCDRLSMTLAGRPGKIHASGKKVRQPLNAFVRPLS